MAEKDIAEKNFIVLNDVFADIFNGLFFHGKQIIAADSLEDLSPTSQYRADNTKLHEQERDTHKLWRGHGINLVLMGIENQTQPDKDMLFRILNYDGSSYRSQLLRTEEKIINGKSKQVPSKERYPVITHVDEFLKLMNVLTGDDRYNELSLSFTETEKEAGLQMCNVLDAREARGLQQGLQQGRAEALIALVNTLRNFTNDKEEIFQAVIKNEVYKNTPREEVFKYLK